MGGHKEIKLPSLLIYLFLQFRKDEKTREKGLIEGYRNFEFEDFHFDITAFLFVQVDGSDNYPNFVEKVQDEPEILECHSITGGLSSLKSSHKKYFLF